MRLNRIIRDQIVSGAMAKLYDKRKAIVDAGAELAHACYEIALSESERKAAATLAAAKGVDWVTIPSNVVSFNVAGQHVAFVYWASHQKAKPIYVPISYYRGNRIGNAISIDKHAKLVDRVRAWQSDTQAHEALENSTRKSLTTLVKSVGSTERLFKAWPEGKEFYSSPPLPEAPARLPAIQMDALNKALGLSA